MSAPGVDARLLRFGLLVAVIALFAVLYVGFDLGRLASGEGLVEAVRAARAWGEIYGWQAAVLLLVIGIGLIILNVPPVIVIIVAGAVYGPAGGIVLGGGAFYAGAVIIYFLGRALGRGFVARIFARTLPRLERRFEGRGMMTVIHMRLLFFGMPPVNWLLSVMNLRFRDFLIGTFLGALPKVLLFGYLGGVIFTALTQKGVDLSWHSPELFLPFLAGILISLALRAVDRWLPGYEADRR